MHPQIYDADKELALYYAVTAYRAALRLGSVLMPKTPSGISRAWVAREAQAANRECDIARAWLADRGAQTPGGPYDS